MAMTIRFGRGVPQLPLPISFEPVSRKVPTRERPGIEFRYGNEHSLVTLPFSSEYWSAFALMGYLNNMPTFLPSVVSTPFLALRSPVNTEQRRITGLSMLQLSVSPFPLASELDLTPCNL